MIREAGLRGMIALRGDLKSAKLKSAVKAAVGAGVPDMRKIVLKAGRGAGWMSPDELLLLLPYGEAAETAHALSAALAAEHHLAVNLSDARAFFRIEGEGAREVLAKLSPTDLAPGRFEAGELRRTRIAQIPAAFWIEDDGFSLACFRSAARYAFDLLVNAASPGGEVGLWR
jgi:sarcosine oxidase subunit gamma